MKKTFDITLFDGHIIITDEGSKILVDTGSPQTFSKSATFQFMDRRPLSAREATSAVNEFSNLAGGDFDTLLGMDIMKNLDVKIDFKTMKITFSDEPLDTGNYHTSAMGDAMGIPYLSLTIKGKQMRFFLDTGAKISYVDPAVTMNESPIAEREDFYPVLGRFTTPVYNLEASISGQSFPAQFGNLPSDISTALKMLGVDGIIGYDLFAAFTIILDFRSKELYFA